MVHWSGYRIALSKAKEDRYEADAFAVATTRHHVADITNLLKDLENSLTAAEVEKAHRIEFDFPEAELKAWASTVITTAYVRAVNAKRGRRFSEEN
jgi:hypothetical protein